MKAVRERTVAQEVAYKKAFRQGRAFKTKLDALVTLENKRVEEQRKTERNEFPSFCSGSFTTTWVTGMAYSHCYTGSIDIDARPDFRPDERRSPLPVMSG